LNLPLITSKFRTIAMFIIVNIYIIFRYVCDVSTQKFGGSVVVSIKLKAKFSSLCY
jgi:hypothetical protein